MKKKYKTVWLKALRSGEYKQTTGKLKDKKGYCCLGVLLECASTRKFYENGLHPCNGGNDMMLSDASVKRYGLHQPEQTHLSCMNDGGLATPYRKKKTFKQIANWIEKHL